MTGKIINRQEFESAATAWEKACIRPSSFMIDYYEGPEADRIVSMGREILPLILERYRQFDKIGNGGVVVGLPGLVTRIVGDISMPNKMSGKIKQMYEYTMNWIMENTR